MGYLSKVGKIERESSCWGDLESRVKANEKELLLLSARFSKGALRTRIAPTPSGFLHPGNLYNFLLIYRLVELNGGRPYLRIDDIDENRFRREYLDDIFRVLGLLKERLGIGWDGASDSDDFLQSFSQRLNKEHYWSYLQRIPQAKRFVCECSRSQRKDFVCCCQEKSLTFIPYQNCIRYHSDVGTGFVVWRRDDWPAYHLTSVVDDEELKINAIIRGTDLTESSRIQLELAGALGLSSFPMVQFFHHDLIRGENGLKLSKSVMRSLG